jgi:AcrR family transcriptional regulator
LSDPKSESTTAARICDALIHLVGKQGYDATTVADVCEKAGVDPADLEECFQDLDACLKHVWEEMTTEYIDHCRAAFDAHDKWRDGLRAAGYAALDWLMEDEARSRFFLIEVMSGGEMVRARRDLMMSEFINMLDAGRQEMADPDSLSRLTAEALTGAVYDNAIASVRLRESRQQARERVKTVMAIAVMPYCGAEAAAEELTIPAPGEAG